MTNNDHIFQHTDEENDRLIVRAWDRTLIFAATDNHDQATAQVRLHRAQVEGLYARIAAWLDETQGCTTSSVDGTYCQLQERHAGPHQFNSATPTVALIPAEVNAAIESMVETFRQGMAELAKATENLRFPRVQDRVSGQCGAQVPGISGTRPLTCDKQAGHDGNHMDGFAYWSSSVPDARPSGAVPPVPNPSCTLCEHSPHGAVGCGEGGRGVHRCTCRGVADPTPEPELGWCESRRDHGAHTYTATDSGMRYRCQGMYAGVYGELPRGEDLLDTLTDWTACPYCAEPVTVAELSEHARLGHGEHA